MAFLAPAAIIGFALGTWLGQHGPGAPSAVVSSTPSPGVASTATATSTVDASEVISPTPVIPTERARAVVLEISGSSDLTSEPFMVSEGWQVQWQIESGELKFGLRGDQNIDTVIDYPGPASGITSPVPVGTFRLVVKASGPWSITVLQPAA